mgnify:CR=1 FL=1
MTVLIAGGDSFTYGSELPSQEHAWANIVAQRQREQQRSVNQENTERQNQCRSFGFADGTPEMANCLLELYKIENQSEQSTAIANPATTTNNSQDLYQSLDLLNRGIDLINGTGNQSAPINSTSRCRRMGDTSGQVYTFSRIGCPVGYAPAL